MGGCIAATPAPLPPSLPSLPAAVRREGNTTDRLAHWVSSSVAQERFRSVDVGSTSSQRELKRRNFYRLDPFVVRDNLARFLRGPRCALGAQVKGSYVRTRRDVRYFKRTGYDRLLAFDGLYRRVIEFCPVRDTNWSSSRVRSDLLPVNDLGQTVGLLHEVIKIFYFLLSESLRPGGPPSTTRNQIPLSR